MKHDILVDFPGSQDGTKTEQFKAGTQRELSPWLAAAIDPSWAKPVGEKKVEKPAEKPAEKQIENKAVVTHGHQTGTLKIKRK